MAKPKPQRIRDPVHNLIEFGVDQFESTLWRVIQTPPFQRLRRIRQLGFSEFVFPGATHSRFAHSIGVFHIARQLMTVIRRYVTSQPDQQFKDTQANYALAAALLHDVGHGMFSHAFESIGKEFKWPMARHEEVSQKLIRDSEISCVLDKEFGTGYSSNVADIIAQDIPDSLYGSVVSSQFDADRLDYIQRDRLMTGVQSSVVDSTWLLANLEIAELKTGVDEADSGNVETLVLGPKAIHTAESYVLALFHLYPNVYFHKTTRGAEKVFQALIRRLVHLNLEDLVLQSGLPKRHPILKFILEPTNLDNAMALDDTVFWGALPMLFEAEDLEIKKLATALRERKLLKCIDIKRCVEEEFSTVKDRHERQALVQLACKGVVESLKEKEAPDRSIGTRFFVDQYTRDPYKRFQDSKSPLNQILIRQGEGAPTDMAEFSPVIANAEPFNFCRAYIFRDDHDAESAIKNEIRTKILEAKNVKA